MHVGGGTGLVPDGFERLLNDDLVDEHLTVVHGNDIAPDTVRQIADRGGTFTVTAEIELQMGYGDPLTGILHAKKAPISIGTDVEPAVGSDLFTCMRLTLQHERNRGIIEALNKSGSRPQSSQITCRHALSWVTTGAAKIAGLDDRIGSLTPGKQADLVMLRTDTLNMTPMHDLVGCAVMQAATANVDTVIIAGRIVKQGGKLLDGRTAGENVGAAAFGRTHPGGFRRTAPPRDLTVIASAAFPAATANRVRPAYSNASGSTKRDCTDVSESGAAVVRRRPQWR